MDQLNALEPDPERPGYFKGYNSKHAWTHKPCFWDLPYFKDLLLPHNIDMMHTEKNIGEAIFGTLKRILRLESIKRHYVIDRYKTCEKAKESRSGRSQRPGSILEGQL